MPKTLARTFAATLAIGSALLLAGCGSNAAGTTVVTADQAQTITVTATSEVNAVPDKARIGLGVTTQAATPQATQDANVQGIDAVIAALAEIGIDEKNIQTTDTYLNPRYDYSTPIVYAEPAMEPDSATTNSAEADEEAEGSDELAEADSAPLSTLAPAPEDDASNIVGYEMTTRLSVDGLDIDQVGAVLQACVAAGATNTDGIQYYSSDYDSLYNEALAAAVGEAHTKAEVLADAADAKLGGVFSMTEGYQNTAYRYESASMFDAVSTEAMTVMPGEIDIEASVTVAYEIA